MIFGDKEKDSSFVARWAVAQVQQQPRCMPTCLQLQLASGQLKRWQILWALTETSAADCAPEQSEMTCAVRVPRYRSCRASPLLAD